MLQKELLLTEICFDTAEDKPSEVCRLGYRYTVNTGTPVIQVYRSRRTGIPVLGSPVPVKPKLSSVRLPSVRLRRERDSLLSDRANAQKRQSYHIGVKRPSSRLLESQTHHEGRLRLYILY